MAKKKNQPQPEGAQEAAQAAPAAPEAAPLPGPEAPAAGKAPATNAQVLSFWGVVLLMVFSAWLLDYLLPGVRERDIERWLMLPFGLFLAYNLYRLR